MTVLQGVLTSAGLGLVAVLMGRVHAITASARPSTTVPSGDPKRTGPRWNPSRAMSFWPAGRTRPAGQPRQWLSVRMGGIVSAAVQDASAGDLAMLPETVGAA